MKIAKVKFQKRGKSYYFNTSIEDLKKGNLVLVDTVQGNQIAIFEKYPENPSITPTKSIITFIQNENEWFEVNGEARHISTIPEGKINFDVPIEDHQNSLIKPNLLCRETMEHIGFRDVGDRWAYVRLVKQDKTGQGFDIGFDCCIYKDNKRIELGVIDEAFGQPYDYQQILKHDPKNRYALEAHLGVQAHMKHLMDSGVITGYKANDYI